MVRPLLFPVAGAWPPGTASRFGVVVCLVSALLTACGCTPNQTKSLLNAVTNSGEEEAPPQAEEIKPRPAPVLTFPSDRPAQPKRPGAAIDVDPGSGRAVSLLAGFRITPPETFNVISEQEGSDFRSSYTNYRWERLSGGAWFIVTFLSGMDYEGGRAPDIRDGKVVGERIRAALARVDEQHRMRSNGSQEETLAGLWAVRTNLTGKIAGQDAVGHLYLLTDGEYFIEIVAVATQSNRGVLKACRESVASLAREPAKRP